MRVGRSPPEDNCALALNAWHRASSASIHVSGHERPAAILIPKNHSRIVAAERATTRRDVYDTISTAGALHIELHSEMQKDMTMIAMPCT